MRRSWLRLLLALAVLPALAAAAAGCGSPGPPAGDGEAEAGPDAASPARPGEPGDLTGVWVARLEHNGQSSLIAMEVVRSEDGTFAAQLTIPDLEIRSLPVGPMTVEGSQVRLGPLTLTLDSGGTTLSGVMPPALVPVHKIQAVFRRAAELPPPPPARPALPPRSPRWTFETGGPIWAGTALSGGRLFAGSDDGNVYALDAATGREIWRAGTGGAVRARPAVDGDLVVALSDDGRLYRLEASSGRQEWSVRLGPPVQRLSPGDEGFRYDHFAPVPLVEGDTIYAAHPGGELHALRSSDGSRLWSHKAGDIVTAGPAAGDGMVFLGSFDGKIVALGARTGEAVWERETGAPVTSSPAFHDGRLIVGSRSYDLMALDAGDGSVIWTYYLWYSWVESSPVVRDGVVYVGSSDAQTLSAVDAGDGTLLWAFDTGGAAWGQPAVTEDAVYIGAVGVSRYIIDHQGGFLAVDRETGRGLWRHGTPAAPLTDSATLWGFASSPSAGPDLVYAGGLDGRIHAFPRRLP